MTICQNLSFSLDSAEVANFLSQNGIKRKKNKSIVSIKCEWPSVNWNAITATANKNIMLF